MMLSRNSREKLYVLDGYLKKTPQEHMITINILIVNFIFKKTHKYFLKAEINSCRSCGNSQYAINCSSQSFSISSGTIKLCNWNLVLNHSSSVHLYPVSGPHGPIISINSMTYNIAKHIVTILVLWLDTLTTSFRTLKSLLQESGSETGYTWNYAIFWCLFTSISTTDALTVVRKRLEGESSWHPWL